MNRRRFLQGMPAVAAAPALAQNQAPPSGRVRVAVIGCGGMGRNDLTDFQRQPDAESSLSATFFNRMPSRRAV